MSLASSLAKVGVKLEQRVDPDYLVVDGSHMLHRVRFSGGEPVTDWKFLAFKFIRTLLNLDSIVKGRQSNPRKIVVAFDKGKSKYRVKLLESYKKDREIDWDSLPEDKKLSLEAYRDARNFLTSHLPTIGILSFLEDGIEADDLGYVAAVTQDNVLLVSEDRDWALHVAAGGSSAQLYRPIQGEFVRFTDLLPPEELDVLPYDYNLMIKALVGDSSDGVPGIYGIGAGWAKKIVNKILTDGWDSLKDGGKKFQSVYKNRKLVEQYYDVLGYHIIPDEEFDELKEFLDNPAVNVDFTESDYYAIADKLDSKTLRDKTWYRRLTRLLGK